MAFSEHPPLRDFPDRAIRELLQDWRNLRDLLPADLLRRIEAVENLERLRAAIRQTVHLTSLDDLMW